MTTVLIKKNEPNGTFSYYNWQNAPQQHLGMPCNDPTLLPKISSPKNYTRPVILTDYSEPRRGSERIVTYTETTQPRLFATKEKASNYPDKERFSNEKHKMFIDSTNFRPNWLFPKGEITNVANPN